MKREEKLKEIITGIYSICRELDYFSHEGIRDENDVNKIKECFTKLEDMANEGKTYSDALEAMSTSLIYGPPSYFRKRKFKSKIKNVFRNNK